MRKYNRQVLKTGLMQMSEPLPNRRELPVEGMLLTEPMPCRMAPDERPEGRKTSVVMAEIEAAMKVTKLRTEESYLFYRLLSKYLAPHYKPRNEHRVLIVGLSFAEEDYSVARFLKDFHGVGITDYRNHADVSAVTTYGMLPRLSPVVGTSSITGDEGDISTYRGWENLRKLKGYDEYDLIIIRGIDPTTDNLKQIIEKALDHKKPDGRVVVTAKYDDEIGIYKAIVKAVKAPMLVAAEDYYGGEINGTDHYIAIW